MSAVHGTETAQDLQIPKAECAVTLMALFLVLNRPSLLLLSSVLKVYPQWGSRPDFRVSLNLLFLQGELSQFLSSSPPTPRLAKPYAIFYNYYKLSCPLPLEVACPPSTLCSS